MTETAATMYRFLSVLLRDEIPEKLLSDMRRDEFMRALEASETARGMAEFLRSNGDTMVLSRELAYEYADLFLNAGPNPVFPYESVHASGQPVVMQKQVLTLRAVMRRAEVHKAPEYHDLDEHAAVEMELAALLLDTGRSAEFSEYFDTLGAWLTAFFTQLEECAESGFYAAAGRTGRVLLESPGALDGLAKACASLELDRYPSLLEPGAQEEEPDREIPTHCYVCSGFCGLNAKLKDGVMVGATGLSGDIKGDGRLCPKGGSTPKHLYSAYRLKAPLVRENGRFRKASWEEALDRTTEGIKSIPPGKLAYFRGNDFLNWFHEALFDHLGCPKGTHRTMCDNSNRMANEHNLSDKRPWMNYQDSDYILHFGLNELATSTGQRKTAQFKAALKRGAKLVVFDPRKSETAAKATEWVRIKPGTDAAAALAMAHVIIRDNLFDQDFVANWTTGFPEFKDRIMGVEDGVARTPEWAENICGVPAPTLERIAREFAGAKNKGALSWTGAAQAPNAHWTTEAIQALNGLCGTFDAPGGPSLPRKRKLNSPWGKGPDGAGKPSKADIPKVGHFGLWSGWSPAQFEDHVDSGLIKGMVMYWGDPVMSWGNSESVSRGFDKLDFCVAIEAFMCNTALKCDVVLPDATWLEQSQVKPDWLYESAIFMFAEVVKPMYDTKPMWRITQAIAQRLGLGDHFPWEDINDAFRNQLDGTPWSFDELREKGFIITDEAEYYKYRKWGSLNPPEGYSSSGKTRTGKYNFLNPAAAEKGGVDPLPDYKPVEGEEATDKEYPFIFGNFRLLQHEHCSTFNNFQLMKLKGKNPLWINELDAERLGIASGDRVRISSPWGRAETEVLATPDIMPGVLGAAGGFGHVRGLEGDPKFPDIGGINLPGMLMRPNTVERVGGTPPLKYIKTRVERI